MKNEEKKVMLELEKTDTAQIPNSYAYPKATLKRPRKGNTQKLDKAITFSERPEKHDFENTYQQLLNKELRPENPACQPAAAESEAYGSASNLLHSTKSTRGGIKNPNTWLVTGNQSSPDDFIGSTNNQALVFKIGQGAHLKEHMRITSAGTISIGGLAPSHIDPTACLHVKGNVKLEIAEKANYTKHLVMDQEGNIGWKTLHPKVQTVETKSIFPIKEASASLALAYFPLGYTTGSLSMELVLADRWFAVTICIVNDRFSSGQVVDGNLNNRASMQIVHNPCCNTLSRLEFSINQNPEAENTTAGAVSPIAYPAEADVRFDIKRSGRLWFKGKRSVGLRKGLLTLVSLV